MALSASYRSLNLLHAYRKVILTMTRLLWNRPLFKDRTPVFKNRPEAFLTVPGMDRTHEPVTVIVHAILHVYARTLLEGELDRL